MEKVKGFLIQYKFWIAGFIVAAYAIYALRGSGTASSGPTYTISDGSTSQGYSDPTLMLAQLEAQTSLASQTADLQAQLNLAQMESDLSRYQIDSESSIGLATIDANKWLAQMDTNLQTSLAQLGSTTQMYIADANVRTAQIGADVANREIDANKYIADKQLKIQKRGQEYQAIQGFLGWAGGFIR